MKNGKERTRTKLENFECIAQNAAYKFDGGLKDASIIGSTLIDYFLPFLPLENHHVIACIRAECETLINHKPTI